MLLIECYTCHKKSLIEFDSDAEHEADDYLVNCPRCGAEIDLMGNELFYDINMDNDVWMQTHEYKQMPYDELMKQVDK